MGESQKDRRLSMENVTIKDIAGACGVSYATVSRTLNRRSGVHPETREKILRVADLLGYSPNLHARSLKTQKTRIIGLILPDISNPFFADIASSVNEIVYGQGYNSILCSTDWNASIEEKQLSLLIDQRVDGLIFKPSPDLTDRYAELPLPKVMISNAQDPRFSWVEIDNVEGGRIAADHLITGCGYRYPAFISGARASRSNQDRLQGFRQRLAELDVPLPDERISFGAYSIESGYRSVEKLDRGGSEADCFFCGNDLIALGALQYLSEKDRPVPDRFGVVGFDDVYFASLPQIQLTTVRQPRRRIGALAAETLSRMIESEEKPGTTQIMLQPELVARHTTAAH